MIDFMEISSPVLQQLGHQVARILAVGQLHHVVWTSKTKRRWR